MPTLRLSGFGNCVGGGSALPERWKSGGEIRDARQNDQGVGRYRHSVPSAVGVGNAGCDAELGGFERSQLREFTAAIKTDIGKLGREIHILLFDRWQVRDPGDPDPVQVAGNTGGGKKGISKEQTQTMAGIHALRYALDQRSGTVPVRQQQGNLVRQAFMTKLGNVSENAGR